jgi:uncharacterized membrane protein YqaE (UPF0057 family)
MKKILVKLFVFIVLTIVTSCSTSNVVAQNIRIQKRKYSNGYHISFFKKPSKKNTQVIDSELKTDENIVENSLEKASVSQLNIPENAISSVEVENTVIENNQIKQTATTSNSPLNSLNRKQNNSNSISIHNSIKRVDNKELSISRKSLRTIIKSQKSGKIDDEKLIFILLLILAFLLPPLSVLLYTNIDWKKVIIATILTCLWWGPGVIYAILVLLEIL